MDTNTKIVIGGEISLKNTIDGEANLSSIVDGEAEKYLPKYPQGYNGSYTVTPSEEEQVLPMSGLMARQNVVVEAIPSNYGRILYNGSTITVY